ncbi:MAG: hypothetical protein A3F12_07815 [Gammaproteobacteria bacterium RIFCSPHIGHO2_12_FULL_38_14]|nr:MAG: hypothetical protein A3F12_07815 [Gammaproteobacteria bacterium RIFCSPHIGHO2_12_FULL_38_14]
METRYQNQIEQLSQLFGEKFLPYDDNSKEILDSWRTRVGVDYIVYPTQNIDYDKNDNMYDKNNMYDEDYYYFKVEIRGGDPLGQHKIDEYGINDDGNVYNVKDLIQPITSLQAEIDVENPIQPIANLQADIINSIDGIKQIIQKKKEAATYQYLVYTNTGQVNLNNLLELIKKTIECKKDAAKQNPEKYKALTELEDAYKGFKNLSAENFEASPGTYTDLYERMIQALAAVCNISYPLLHPGKEEQSHSKENVHVISQILNGIGGIFAPARSQTLHEANKALDQADKITKTIDELTNWKITIAEMQGLEAETQFAHSQNQNPTKKKGKH